MLLGEKHNPKPASFISTLVEAYDILNSMDGGAWQAAVQGVASAGHD